MRFQRGCSLVPLLSFVHSSFPPSPPSLTFTYVVSIKAWSMWNGPLTKTFGVVASSAADWSLGEIMPVFTTTAIALGATTFFLGQNYFHITALTSSFFFSSSSSSFSSAIVYYPASYFVRDRALRCSFRCVVGFLLFGFFFKNRFSFFIPFISPVS